MSDYLLLAVGVLLTIGTGLFVASEFSLISVERIELEKLRDSGKKGLDLPIKSRHQDFNPPIRRPAGYHAYHSAHWICGRACTHQAFRALGFWIWVLGKTCCNQLVLPSQ